MLLFILFKAEDPVNSTTKYIQLVIFDRGEDISAITYAINVRLNLHIYIF